MTRQSSTARILSASRWEVATVVLLLVVGIGRLGPESYLGVDADAITWGIIGLFLAWLLARWPVSGGTGVETNPDGPARVGEHYRPADGTGDRGVYRVVGTGDEVTLLEVADADDRRAHTGSVRRVDRSTLPTDFEAADDPDRGFVPRLAIRNAASGLYWSVRQFL